MRKTPSLLLAALALCALASRGALADSAPADNTAAAAPIPAAAATPAAAPAVTATPATPAAKVADTAGKDEKDKEKKNAFPLHGNVSIDNAWGQAFLANNGSGVDIPINGGTQNLHFATPPGHPQWGTSVSLGGSASLPKLDPLPKMSLSTGVSLNMSNWITSADAGVYDRQVSVSDVNVGLGLGQLYQEEFTKITVSGRLGTRLPISMHSRHVGLILPFSAGVSLGWNSPEWSWGQLSFGYSAGLGVNWYGDVATKVPGVGNAATGNQVPADPYANSIPIAYCRTTEQLSATGECFGGGRQGLWSLNNGLNGSWSLGNHGVSIGMGFSHGFLRDLSNAPALSSPNASGQNFNESINGNISYSYDVPVDFAKVSLSAGIGSGGPAWQTAPVDKNGNANQYIRFPFWNFDYPNSNASSAFVSVGVGL